ncbi:hypothetical protein ANN_15925 [Periplaneta americana]|uniref:Major facilitator superfamily (MFS) profile domain-containing protein n=1 Tax=Periplaneta americana TaxID=6978 RepID=A0ABQ8SHK2_PERAM|nr:hypothetical protein ANN_15925 [Periplaneta americana]
MGKEFSREMSANVWDRCSPNIVMNLLIVASVCALGGTACGLSTGHSAVLIPRLHQNDSTIPIDDDIGSWIASIYSMGMPLGNIIGGSLTDRLGRRMTLRLSQLSYILGWILLATAQSHQMVIAARFILGIARGMIVDTVFILMDEHSDARLRGILSLHMSLTYVFGILIITGLGTVLEWRITTVVATFFSIAGFLATWVVPESPIWLVRNGKTHMASCVLEKAWGKNQDSGELYENFHSIILLLQKRKIAAWFELRNNVAQIKHLFRRRSVSRQVDRSQMSNFWPPRSPDLTLLDFFFWGLIKDRLYATNPRTIPELLELTERIIQMVTPNMLTRVHEDLIHRLHLCIQQNEGHFENSLTQLQDVTTPHKWYPTSHAVSDLKRFYSVFFNLFQARQELETMITRCQKDGNVLFKMFLRPHVIKSFVISFILIMLQVFCGTHMFVFYSVDIISRARHGSQDLLDEYAVTNIAGFLRIAVLIVMAWVSLGVKRRTIILTTAIVSSICLLSLGSAIAMNATSKLMSERAQSWLLLSLIFMYIALSSIGIFTIPTILIGELLPSKIRGLACGVIYAINEVVLGSILKSYPLMCKTMGIHGMFWLFGSFCLSFALFVFLFVPETHNHTLIQIEEYFQGQNILWQMRPKVFRNRESLQQQLISPQNTPDKLERNNTVYLKLRERELSETGC